MTIETLDTVKKLITEAENAQIEFKETTGQLERGMETLCAFLNGIGGTVLFGVKDKGTILGQEISDKTKRDIVEAIKRLEPIAAIGISYIPIPNTQKYVIALTANEQPRVRPFMYKGRAYTRMESVTSVMTQEHYNVLLLQRGDKYSWERIVNPDYKIEHLDSKLILGAVRMGVESGRLPENSLSEDIPSLLGKLNLMSEDGGLKNASAVLFGKNLSDYPQCLLRMARFRGADKNEFIDNQRVEGNIFVLLDAAMAFFFKHLSLSGKVEGLYREEELEVPYKALRECCINALAHRLYIESGSSVSIGIYDDRIEITNSGFFPYDMSMEKLLGLHESKPQNPIIANVLYKTKVLESWGRGIGLMVSECQRVGIAEPEFESDGTFVKVIFKYKHSYVGQDLTSTPQAPPKHPLSTPQVRSLVSIIGDSKYSVTEMMELLELKDRKHFRNSYLNPAINEGFVELTHPEQPKHPNQKYYLTDKGKALLK